MKHKYLPQIYGLVKDFHPRMIPDDKASDGLNALFEKGQILNRWGYASFGSVPLNGGITAIKQFEQLITGTKTILVFTTRDSYKYNAETGEYVFITKIYIAGQVACSAGTTVTGNGTSFDSSNWPAGVCEIKFGTQDPNATGTPDTWYTVSTWTDATHLELTGNGPNTGGDVNYVIRLCWSGDDDDIHSIAIPYDDAASDNIIVVTNGVDPIQKWDGTGYMEDLGGSPNKAKYIGYFGSVGYEHLILGWTNDGSNNLPQTIELSDAGETETWGGTYYDLLDTNDQIKGILSLQTRLIVYKERSITEAWPNPSGGNLDPLDFNQNKIRDIGTYSIRTVVDFGMFHIFAGTDNIYKFDGSNIIPIGSEVIKSMLEEISKVYMHRAFAFPIRDKSLYCLFVPTNESEYCNKAYVYNHRENHWTIWELDSEVTCFGVFEKETAETWTEIYDGGSGPSWTDSFMRWCDLIVYDNNQSFLLGDKDGNVYEFHSRHLDDNGTEIDFYITTKDYPLNDPKHTFRLNELVLGLADNGAGNMRVRASTDFGENWSEWVSLSVNGSVDYHEKVAGFLEKGKQVRFQLSNGETGSKIIPITIESLMVGYNDAGVER